MAAASQEQQLALLTARVDELEASVLPASSANSWWLISNGLVVFFMQCGFGMLEAGSVTTRATQNILLKNLLDTSISAIVWYCVGFGIAFDGDSAFMGTPGTAGANGSSSSTLFFTYRLQADDANGFASENSASGYDWAFWWFQFTFAAAAATIVSGAVAERAHLVSYLIYSTTITLLIYPVVVHWAWSDAGWLSVSNPSAWQGGVVDFAGSGVVHLTGGIAALCGAAVIGPRPGRFMATGPKAAALACSLGGARCARCSPCCHEGGDGQRALPMPGHSSVLQALGTFILWMGWYGFNAGSTLSIDGSSPATAARIFATTTLSASCGGVTTIVLQRVRGAGKQWDVAAMCNGVLAGLVSITAGCATCPAWAAVVIGIIGGVVLRCASLFVLNVMHVDDPLDAFAVHGACGAWGVLACALFSTDYYTAAVFSLPAGGVMYGGSAMLCAALLFLASVIGWVGSLSLILFLSLRRLGVLRLPLPPTRSMPVPVSDVMINSAAHSPGTGARTAAWEAPEMEHAMPPSSAMAPEMEHAPDAAAGDVERAPL